MKKPAGPMGLMDHIESMLAHRTFFGRRRQSARHAPSLFNTRIPACYNPLPYGNPSLTHRYF